MEPKNFIKFVEKYRLPRRWPMYPEYVQWINVEERILEYENLIQCKCSSVAVPTTS